MGGGNLMVPMKYLLVVSCSLVVAFAEFGCAVSSQESTLAGRRPVTCQAPEGDCKVPTGNFQDLITGSTGSCKCLLSCQDPQPPFNDRIACSAQSGYVVLDCDCPGTSNTVFMPIALFENKQLRFTPDGSKFRMQTAQSSVKICAPYGDTGGCRGYCTISDGAQLNCTWGQQPPRSISQCNFC